jgi:transposase
MPLQLPAPEQNESLEQEVARLKKELQKAKMERDLLKKATAYFASLEK